MSVKIKSRKTIKNAIVQQIECYNGEGKIVRDEEYEEGIVVSVEIYRYENQYSLKERFNSEGILRRRDETWYNENNEIEKEDFGFATYYYQYGADKRLLSMKKFDSENNIENSIEYSYVEDYEYRKFFNSSGILISLSVTRYNDAKKPFRTIYFEIPHHDFIGAEESEGYMEFFEMMKIFGFDIDGNMVDTKISMYFLVEEIVFEYDQFGNTISEEMYHYDGESLEDKLAFRGGVYNYYNENNLLIKYHSLEIKTDWDDELCCLYEYVLDEKGLIIEKSTDSGFNKIIEKFNYNSKGKLISYVENRNNGEEVKEILYDDFGNKISEITELNFDGEYEKDIKEYEIEYY
ncbi:MULTISPECIES: hypothetical protein [unclassified Flavobacterium]|jgi:hypothetical protein|uniref:hypothetical protein n=1 Tax=unclassified Flavobacterium TaxID=196869 RepID=UPI00057C53DE|nr:MULTISPECIES: hypothetical protein [unclassified Flavobacterium]KIA93632.1 hypothetical protein OA93_21760 [Flavobacterium sp. KMS]MEA9412813.1 hypothetical protein [Flavobacterium sp. PL02]